MTIRLSLVVLLLGVALRASAASVAWEFRGVIRQVDVAGPDGGDPGPLAAALGSLGAGIGAELVASIRFETSTVDVDLDPSRGDYRGPIDILHVTLGAWNLGFDSATLPSSGSQIVVARHSTAEPPLFLEIISGGLVDPTGVLDRVALFGTDLFTLDPEIFPTDALSGVPPPLASLVPYFPYGSDPVFGYGTLGVLAGCGSLGCATLYAELVSIVAVPEPAMATLLGVGSVALAALRRRATS